MKNSGSCGIKLREFWDVFSLGKHFPNETPPASAGESHHFWNLLGEAGMLDLDEVSA